MKFRKFLTIGIAALTVAAFSFGLAACKPDTEDPGKDPETPGGDTPVAPAEVTVEGGYGYYPPDQGGIGLELNLYEDGTYYIYYLKDQGDSYNHSVYLTTTQDFVTYEEYQEPVLEASRGSEQDAWIGTGSVVKVGEKYYFFYTGHNTSRTTCKAC